MKGRVELIKHRCELSDIRDGECFVFDDVDCDTVFMKCSPTECKNVPIVDLGTGKVDSRPMHSEVIPVHCEFLARTLTIEEAKDL